MFPFCQLSLQLQLDEKQLTFWILRSLIVSSVRILLQETSVLLQTDKNARQTPRWWKTNFQVFIPVVSMKYTDLYRGHNVLYLKKIK